MVKFVIYVVGLVRYYSKYSMYKKRELSLKKSGLILKDFGSSEIDSLKSYIL